MDQKVIQIGSSAGVTISKETLKNLGVAIGDTVETGTVGKTFSVKPKQKEFGSQVDPVILEWTDMFIKKNRELLERLADK